MNREIITTAITATGASLARALAGHTPLPRLSRFRPTRGSVMTSALRTASIPVIVALLALAAGLLVFLSYPVLAQSDATAPSNLTAQLVDGGALLT